jgi:hypothetical protein
VAITSFNEWHEGTQIEPAVPFTDRNGTGFHYLAYDRAPEQYLEITLEMVYTLFIIILTNGLIPLWSLATSLKSKYSAVTCLLLGIIFLSLNLIILSLIIGPQVLHAPPPEHPRPDFPGRLMFETVPTTL